MSPTYKSAAVAAFLSAALVLGHGEAGAAPVTLTDTAVQTVDAQGFVFNFLTMPGSDGTAGSLTIRIRGDFSIGASLGESYAFNLDGLVSATGVQATAGNLITGFDPNDNLFEQTFAIAGPVMSTIAADGSAVLSVQYASGVNVALSANPFIEVTLRYESAVAAVPVPGSLALFGLAVATAGAIRRRRG